MSEVSAMRKRRLSRMLAAAKRPKRQPPAPPFPVPLTATQTRLRLVWAHRFSLIYNRLFHDVVREVCSYIEDPLVIEMWEDLVGFFDTKTGAWEKYVSLEEFGLNCSYASYARIDVGRLFVTGALSGTTDLHSLSYIFHFGIEGFNIEKMPQMLVSRQMAGLLHHRNVVYIFGGVRVKRNSALSVTSFSRSAECLDLATATQWRKLAEHMCCRRIRITPCEYQSKAYLCGGYPRYDKSMTCIEVFNLQTERYEDPLYMPLPVEASVISFVIDGELVLIANAVVARQNLKDALALSKLERQPNLSSCAARGAPIICGEFIYWTYAKTCTRVKYTDSPMRVEKFEMIRGGSRTRRVNYIIVL